MWEQLRRFRGLEPAARGLFVRASLALPLVALSLRVRGFRATHRSLQNLIPAAGRISDHQLSNDASSGGDLSDGRAMLTAGMVTAAARRSPVQAGCLERSLTLWWLLKRQGIACHIRIGTRRVGDKFDAHAWVECEGQPLNEPDDLHKHYAAFEEAFPAIERAKK
jgi:Transglutaminase-like superfamily